MQRPIHSSCKLLASVVLAASTIAAAAKTTGNALVSHPYWNQGGAEISVYELQQNRYREVHLGQLITVVVKEDFLLERQVKNESYTDPKSTGVVKRIELRRFPTGVYDYSVFSSIFTPLDKLNHPSSLKATSSAQEWCGTTFLQMNRTRTGYVAQQNSYFENEGDRKVTLPDGVLEDELFNRLRMSPSDLPQGEFELIPALWLLQLQHIEMRSYTALAQIGKYTGRDFSGNDLNSYTVNIPDLRRVLTIVYEKEAPHTIVGWSDSYPSISDKVVRTSRVTLKSQKVLEYWNLSRLKDQKIRDILGITGM